MIRIIIAITFIVFTSNVTALEKCDILGSLEADPLKKTVSVKFEDLQYVELIEACTEAIAMQDHYIARYYLLRARGYLRSGSYEKATSEDKLANAMRDFAEFFGEKTKILPKSGKFDGNGKG